MINLEAVTMWWLKGQFKMKDRFEFYNMLILLLDNGVQINDALNKMYGIFTNEGKKKRDIVGKVCQDCAMGISEGAPISEVLEKWVSYDEFSLIKAGEASGNLQDAFRKSMKVLDNKKRIFAALMTCTLYPGLLASQAAYLLYQVSTDLIPKLGRSSNPENWNSAALALQALSVFVVKHGLATLLTLVSVVILTFISMPLLNGPLRVYLDRIPPWSLYRAMHGSTFLQNVGVLLSSGVSLPVALETMKHAASPWLTRRIEDTLHGVTIGSNLGLALHDAGHEFPDKRAIQLLRVISDSNGSEEVIENFGERWIEQSISNLQATSKIMLGIAIVFNAGIMLLVLFGASGMQDGLLSGMKR